MTERINVLIPGSRAREHATAYKLRQSPHINKIFIAPGNAATAALGTNLDIARGDTTRLETAIRDNNIQMVIPLNEESLAAGLVDVAERNGILAYGPTQELARLEWSKSYAQTIMEDCRVPHPRGFHVTTAREAYFYAMEHDPLGYVIKADGLADGKGVYLPSTKEEAREIINDVMIKKIHGEAGNTVLFQERLYGTEESLIAFISGETIIALPKTRDYKRLKDNDEGPNTGGMGSVVYPDEFPSDETLNTFIAPFTRYFARIGKPLKGMFYVQLIHTNRGTKALEINFRPGDPEWPAQVRTIEADIYSIFEKTAKGNLKPRDVKYNRLAVANIAIAVEGYPKEPKYGDKITGLDRNFGDDIVIFHAGTKREGNNVLTNGGRALEVTATGKTISEAVNKINLVLDAENPKIYFRGMQRRYDIGE